MYTIHHGGTDIQLHSRTLKIAQMDIKMHKVHRALAHIPYMTLSHPGDQNSSRILVVIRAQLWYLSGDLLNEADGITRVFLMAFCLMMNYGSDKKE